MLMNTPLEHHESQADAFRDNQPLPSLSGPPPGTSAQSKQAHPTGCWRRVRQTVRASTFSPTWLAVPWSLPVVGYVAAVCMPATMILLTRLLVYTFPHFALQGVLSLFAILVVALLWGTGPGLVATFIGAFLFNYFILPPPFTWSFFLLQPLLETLMFLAFGVSISLVVSRIEYARAQASREKVLAATQARELETILATIADGVYVYDAEGHLLRVNPAAQAFNPYSGQDSYRAQPFPERFSSFHLRDEQGQLLTTENLPVIRALRGEMLTGTQAIDIQMQTVEGEDRFYNVSSAPIRDETGGIQGAVNVMRDVTERKRLERESAELARRTSEALHALVQFAQTLVQAGVAEGASSSEAGEAVDRVDQVANRLASLMSQVLGNHGVGITAFKPLTQRPVATATHGLNPEHERGWRERRQGFTIQELIAGTSVERSLQAGEPVVIDLSSPPFSAHPTIYGTRKVLLIPMIMDGQPIGVVTCIAQ